MTFLSFRKQCLRLKQSAFIFVLCKYLINLKTSSKCKSTHYTVKNKGYPPFINIIFQRAPIVKIYLHDYEAFNKLPIN